MRSLLEAAHGGHLTLNQREQLFRSHSCLPELCQREPHLVDQLGSHGVGNLFRRWRDFSARPVAYRQEALALNAKEISALGRTMHERLGKLADHFSKLGNSLNSAVDHYNRAIGSYETRAMSTARKFEELKAAPENTSLPDIEAIDKTTRPLLANPDVDIEAKDDFAFVPEKDAASKKAASDLRSVFEDY